MRGRVYVRGSIISIHALLTESDPRKMALQCSYRAFLSTLSLRRATALRRDKAVAMDISIHALLTESDAEVLGQAVQPWKFLSTLSLRRATAAHTALTSGHVHFYPRSPYGERPKTACTTSCATKFLSTLSLRRATCSFPRPPPAAAYFYPRSPYGERLIPTLSSHAHPGISIHALLTESDRFCMFSHLPYIAFLSTLSLRRATHPESYLLQSQLISIHALLTESDAMSSQ